MFGHDEPQTATDNNTPVMTDHSAPTLTDDTLQSSAPEADTATTDSDVPSGDTQKSEDLLTIKQDALKQLGPLVSHLDQTPEEKFRTTMMMIQATDDKSLIKDAYDAAQKISSEKTRAQALLDIVNEINYFTQHPTE